MRARAAYIHSLGTTGILIAASMLMLALTSAIVTFRGWPGNDSSTGVQSLPLQPALPTLAAVKTHQAAHPLVRVHSASAPHGVVHGLVKVSRAQRPVAVGKVPQAVPGRPATQFGAQPQATGPRGHAPASAPGGGGGPADPITGGTPLGGVQGELQGMLPPAGGLPGGLQTSPGPNVVPGVSLPSVRFH
jgi:hypothetical protein